MAQEVSEEVVKLYIFAPESKEIQRLEVLLPSLQFKHGVVTRLMVKLDRKTQARGTQFKLGTTTPYSVRYLGTYLSELAYG